MKAIVTIIVNAALDWLAKYLQRKINQRVDKRKKEAEQKVKDQLQKDKLERAKTNEEILDAAIDILNNRYVR